MTNFSQLNNPIPFNQVGTNPWLFDSSANHLEDHATRIFRAERLVDVWTNRDPRHIHAVVRFRERECASLSITPTALRSLADAIYTERRSKASELIPL